MLTRLSLAPFEGVVDVDEGEVVSLGVMEPSVALVRLANHASRGRQKTARRWRKESIFLNKEKQVWF